jgi:hypothetical protein
MHLPELVVLCVVLSLGGLLPGIAMPDTALAAEPIVREHSYDVTQGLADIEQQITDEEGTTYILREISNPLPATNGAPSRQFTATVQRPVTLELESQGASAVRTMFPEALALDTGDYVGTLRLQSVSQEPVYRSVEEQVEHLVVYPDLLSEDVLQLPEQEEFVVSSDEELEATTTKTLNRLAVSWKTTGYDADGRPQRYEATVVFRGVQRHLTLDYFVATALYAGIVPARVQGETVLATYDPVIAPVQTPVPTPAETIPPVLAVPLSAPPLSLGPLVIVVASAIVMLLALLFLLYFFLYKNARLVSVSPTGQRRVLARKHLRLEKGEAVFRVEPTCGLYRRDFAHLIVLNRGLARRQGLLTVLWGDQLILRVSLRCETEITAELVEAVEEELGHMLQEDTGTPKTSGLPCTLDAGTLSGQST